MSQPFWTVTAQQTTVAVLQKTFMRMAGIHKTVDLFHLTTPSPRIFLFRSSSFKYSKLYVMHFSAPITAATNEVVT